MVTVHAGNTAAAPASEVEAIIRSPPPMDGSSRAMLATAGPSCFVIAIKVADVALLYVLKES